MVKTNFLCVLLSLFVAWESYGQNKTQPPSLGGISSQFLEIKQSLQTQIEQQVDKTLQRHLMPEDFQIFVDVKFKSMRRSSDETPLPYALGENSAPIELGDVFVKKLVSQINIYILIDKSIESSFLKPFREIVLRRLQSTIDAKVNLKFSRAKLSDIKRDSKIHNSNQYIRLQQDLLEQKKLIEQERSLKSSAETELAVAKGKITELAQKVETEKQLRQQALKEAQQMLETKLEEKKQKFEKEIQDKELASRERLQKTQISQRKLETIIYSVIFGILAVILYLIFRLLGRSMERGLVDISKSLGKMSASSATSRPVEPPKVKSASEPARIPSMPSMPTGELKDALIKLQAELLEVMEDDVPMIVYAHLNEKILAGEDIFKVILSLELLGKKLAFKIFQNLSESAQKQIADTLQSEAFPHNKLELMLAGGEELKTLMSTSILRRQNPSLNEEYLFKIQKMSAEKLANMLMEVDSGLLGRLYCYIPPGQLASCFTYIKENHAGRFAALSASLGEAHNYMQSSDLDERFLGVIDSFSQMVDSQQKQEFYSYYKTVIDQADDNTALEIYTSLKAKDPDLAGYLRENVITFLTFFELSQEYQEIVVEKLGVSGVASLRLQLEPEKMRIIEGYLNQNERIILEDEIQTLSAQTRTNKERRFAEAKRSVVAIIRALASEVGSLRNCLLRSDNRQEQGDMFDAVS